MAQQAEGTVLFNSTDAAEAAGTPSLLQGGGSP